MEHLSSSGRRGQHAARVDAPTHDLSVRCDLRSRQTLTGITIKAPGEGRTKARINWLLRQLSDASDDLRIEATYPNARETTGALLGQIREDADCLRYPADLKREPRSFTVTLSRPMGKKRGKEEGSFVRETRAQTFAFYRDLVQDLKAWQARAPKLREESTPDSDGDVPRPDPPPAAAVEGREPGEAKDPLSKLGHRTVDSVPSTSQEAQADLTQSEGDRGIPLDDLA